MVNVLCENCGAESVVQNPAALSVVCAYCDSVLLLVDQQWKDSGDKSRLSQGFSRLYIGAYGSIQDERIHVIGRARYSFGRGFWDEWYVLDELGNGTWITEDNHEFCRQKRIDVNIDTPANISPGMDIRVENIAFRVLESGQAECIGIEGELPKEVRPGVAYRYTDASSFDGVYALGIEHHQSSPTIFLGTWLNQEDIKMDDESLDW